MLFAKKSIILQYLTIVYIHKNSKLLMKLIWYQFVSFMFKTMVVKWHSLKKIK